MPQLHTYYSDGDRSSSGWYKGAMGSLVCGFLLALLSIEFDGYRASSTPTWVYPCNENPSRKPTTQWWRCLVSMIPRLLPASSVYTMTYMSFTKSQAVSDTHIISWNAWLGRRTVTPRSTTSICKFCMPVNHTTMQCTTKLQTTVAEHYYRV